MVLLARSPPRVSLTCTTFRVPHAWGVHQAPASLLPQRRVSHLDKHVRHTVIAMCQTTQDTIRLDDGTFVHAPVPQCAAPASTATLLILLPGALLQPDDYKHLARALQLWVASQYINTNTMSAGEFPDVQPLLDAAEALGFGNATLQSGRLPNVYCATHSLSGIYATTILQRFGGLVQMATCQQQLRASGQPIWQRLEAWGRPVAHIGGVLDGQCRPVHLLPPLAEAAVMACKFGHSYAAKRKPVLLLPHVNHANFSNGTVNTTRGDLETSQSLEESSAAIAAAMVDFVTANRGHGSAVEDAVAHLVAQQRATMQLVGCMAEATGFGNVAAAYEGADDTGSVVLPGGLVQGSTGAEHVPDPTGKFMARPEQLVAAERAACDIQRRLLAGIPEAYAARVKIVATAHTDDITFIYGQPTISNVLHDSCIHDHDDQNNNQVLLHVHVLLDRPVYQATQTVIGPLSPVYTLKLKKPSAVLYALGAEDAEVADQDTLDAAEINADTAKQVYETLPASVRTVFDQRGRVLCFEPDSDASGDLTSPVEWIRERPVQVADAQPGHVMVQSSYISTPSARMPSYETGTGVFVGNYYIKCMSPGWFAEWYYTDGLRAKQLPVPSWGATPKTAA